MLLDIIFRSLEIPENTPVFSPTVKCNFILNFDF